MRQLRHQVAESQRTFFRRQAVKLDASKVARLEGDLVDQVDFVTAITPEDLELYERRRGDKPMGVLTPGYRGRKLSQREITGGGPRRAVIIGSFDWIGKRINLEEFVEVADPIARLREAARGTAVEIQPLAPGAWLDWGDSRSS